MKGAGRRGCSEKQALSIILNFQSIVSGKIDKCIIIIILKDFLSDLSRNMCTRGYTRLDMKIQLQGIVLDSALGYRSGISSPANNAEILLRKFQCFP